MTYADMRSNKQKNCVKIVEDSDIVNEDDIVLAMKQPQHIFKSEVTLGTNNISNNLNLKEQRLGTNEEIINDKSTKVLNNRGEDNEDVSG